MHLRLDLPLPASADRAAALLADPQFARDAASAAGAGLDHVELTGSPDGAFTVTTRRSFPADQIPAHLRGFVGGRIDVRQVDAWEAPRADGSRVGTVVVEIAGAPVRLTGRSSLHEQAPGSTLVTYEGELRAAIPLFGAAVEQAAAGTIRTAFATTAEVARAHLS
ncbi:DUF2505 domain-containing protein [Cellulomonas sp. HZM]|uniref:DUF2505 domain-containing protein n=1 Tax=Cellulomonas sp. HZM TaxID=1454010 RepID=UPI0005505EBD|nr:DUF2505 domain-containing protein [Cellulomonas sp. HZM]